MSSQETRSLPGASPKEAERIPVLDWRRYAGGTDMEGFVADLSAACRSTGFFLLKHHGIDHALIADVFASADQFFALSDEAKGKVSINSNPHNRGWAAMGTERLDEASGQIDRKEAFNIGLDLAPNDPRVLRGDPFRGANLWPPVPGFRDVSMRYFEAALNLGVCLHRALASDLGLAEDYFEDKFSEPMATLRLLNYPPGRGEAGEIGAGAHTDYGSITLLMTDGEAGLQVRPRDGDWIDVPQVDDTYVVNIGDCLMRWSNDTYVSTPHRVLPPARRRRSVAFFLDPNPDAVIAALPGTGEPRYPPVTGAEYLRSRLEATYA
ncbi:MAG: 2-oxoglutarate and iron-dependent oxygenase domain-containing protein [Pseudomonadota bacterium]